MLLVVESMSAYKVAIGRTTRTIDQRARYFRNQIVAVVITSLCSIGAAAATSTLWPLTGLLLLVPICGFCFLLDGKLLNDWRSQLFVSWAKREVDFWAFRDAMEAIPTLPKTTLQSMLETLPSTPDWGMEQAVPGRTREIVAAVVTAIHACPMYTLALKTVGCVIAAVSVLCAILLEVWYPLLFGAAILPLPLLSRWMKRWRLCKLQAAIIVAQRDPDFNTEAYENLVNRLDWSAITISERAKFIAAAPRRVPSAND